MRALASFVCFAAVLGSQAFLVAGVLESEEKVRPIADRVEEMADAGRTVAPRLLGQYALATRPMCPSAARIRARLGDLGASGGALPDLPQRAALVTPWVSVDLSWLPRGRADWFTLLFVLDALLLVGVAAVWRWRARPARLDAMLLFALLAAGILVFDFCRPERLSQGVVAGQWIAAATVAGLAALTTLFGASARTR